MVKYWFAFAAWIKILQFISATCEGAGVTRIICSHIELSTGNDTCIVERTEISKFPGKEDETAPAVSSFKAEWFIQERSPYKTGSVIGLNVSWSQEVTSFKEVVTGYLLSLDTGNLLSTTTTGFHVTFPNKSRIIELIDDTSEKDCDVGAKTLANLPHLLQSFKASTFLLIALNDLKSIKNFFVGNLLTRKRHRYVPFPKVVFIFSDIGLFTEIRPKETCNFFLFSLPFFHANTNPVCVTHDVPIPGCEEFEDLNQTENCKNFISDEEMQQPFYITVTKKNIPMPSITLNKPTDTSLEGKRFRKTSVLVAALVSAALTCIVFIVAMLLRIRHHKKKCLNDVSSEKSKRKEVLFVVDVGLEEERSAYHETAGRLAFILQRHGRIDVKCNLWYISTISDPHLWLMNNIKTADYVVLFLTPLKSKFISESNWITFLSTYSYQGFCIKPCGKMDDKIFLVHIADKPKYELSKSYKTYRIMNDFKKFFKNVTGKSVSKHIPKNVLENLEQVASLELIV